MKDNKKSSKGAPKRKEFKDKKEPTPRNSFNFKKDSKTQTDRPSGEGSGFKKEYKPRGEKSFSDKGDRPSRDGESKREYKPRTERPSGEGSGFKKEYKPRGEKSFSDKGDRPSRDGEFKREYKPRTERPSGEGSGFKKEYKPRGEKSFSDKGDRPSRDGEFKREYKPRTERPSGEGSGFKKEYKPRGEKSFSDKGDRPSRDGEFKREYKPRTERPSGEGSGFKKEYKPRGEKNFSDKDERPNREDSAKKEYKPLSKKDFPVKEKNPNHEPTPEKNDGTMRLNKFIASSGLCARRKADELIEQGFVTVNDVVIKEMGYRITGKDKVCYKGKPVTPKTKLIYILLNKPKNYITTTEDERGRGTVLDLLQGATKERIYPVGRLDRMTTGLLLFTNDGELARKMTHPSDGIRKLYYVQLDKKLSTDDFEKIESTIVLEDGPAPVDNISFVEGTDGTEVGVQIHIGRNRIVRRIFEHLGYEVVKLDRVGLAHLTKKDLPRGKWRFLTEKEVIYLKNFK